MPTATLAQQPVRRAEIHYRCFEITKQVHDSEARIRVVNFGRRSGKSLMALMEGFFMSYKLILAKVNRPRGIIVAPTNKMLRENWQTANEVLKQIIVQSYVSEQRIDLGAFGTIDFVSTESQGGAGRGAGYNWAVLDEASRIPKDAWESDLRPALADRQGRALIISTPNGLNWFYDLYQQALQGDPQMAAFRASTLDCWRSRFVNKPEQLAAYEQEWEFLQRTTSVEKFRQEFLAEFLQDQGQHFTLKDGLWRGSLRPALPGCHYLAGVDVARKDDWMATIILEVESQQVVGLIRSRHQDWAMQKAISLELLKQYPQCLAYVDSTGVGDPIAQDLRVAGINVMDVLFTPRTKSELVENLTLAIEQCYLGIPKELTTQWLVDELQQYQSERMPSGLIRYGAPEGKHDDGVTALMLAAFGLQGSWKTPDVSQVFDGEWWENLSQPKNPWEALAYSHEVRQFARRFPGQATPLHPQDIRWLTHAGAN